MTFEILDSVTLAGDPTRPNEDAFGHDPGAAVVLDGATGLGENLLPGPSDAAWIAHFGARRLIAHLRDGESAHDALAYALADAEKSFIGLRRRAPKEKWEIPYASMMLATLEKARTGLINFLWFGDCAALVACPGAGVDVIGETLKKRAAESLRAAEIAREKGLAPAAGINRPEFIGALRAARGRANSGRSWLFSPDRRAAAHVAHKSIDAPAGTLVLLATDGFLALVSDYKRYDSAGLMAAAREKGLGALAAEIRAIEADDEDGRKFPRFKKNDDSTALLLRIV